MFVVTGVTKVLDFDVVGNEGGVNPLKPLTINCRNGIRHQNMIVWKFINVAISTG